MSAAAHRDPPSDPRAYLRFSADFLIECKQSELPFTFFLRDASIGEMPRLAGAPYDILNIEHRYSNGPSRKIRVGLTQAIELSDLPFRSEPPTAIAMSKAQRKGSELELSGEETYRNLALPLTKALNHYIRRVKPPEYRMYFDIRIVFPVAVLRAPMVGVKMEDQQMKMTAIPWVRLARSEVGADCDYLPRISDRTSFDVVHVDYLRTYTQQAMGTATEIARRLDKIAASVITGRAVDSHDSADSAAKTKAESKLYDILKPMMTSADSLFGWMNDS